MPRRILTPAQIAIIGPRISAGETVRDLAAEWGVSRSTISYHLSDGRRRNILGRPWQLPLRRARFALQAGDYQGATAFLREAADATASRIES